MSISQQEYENLLYSKLYECESQYQAYLAEHNEKLNFNAELNYMYKAVMSGVGIEGGFPYTPLESIVESFLKAAKLGLSLDPSEQFCFLRSQYDHSTGLYHTELGLGYKGVLRLAYRSGKVKQIVSNVFYNKDNFQFNGPNSKVTHSMTVLSTSARGNLAGGYCQTELVDGSFIVTVMPPEEILAIEEQGKSVGNPAWLSAHVNQMREKTLILRHWKTLYPAIYSSSLLDSAQIFDDECEEFPFSSPSQGFSESQTIGSY